MSEDPSAEIPGPGDFSGGIRDWINYPLTDMADVEAEQSPTLSDFSHWCSFTFLYQIEMAIPPYL